MLARLLTRKRSYEVRVENHPQDALPVALDFRPDLILLDVIMPEMDGGTVARLIRRAQPVENVPIVFISASAHPIPGYPFLSKPVPVDEVIACIEAQIGKE